MDPLDQNPTSLGAVGVPDPSGISGMPPKVDDGNTSALKTTDALNPLRKNSADSLEVFL